jgi:NH3-dependent NAD+ synthetase
MNYFDIFRIDYDDLKMIAEHPEALKTSVHESSSGYIGEITLLGEYPDRNSNVLFAHETEFNTSQEALNDLSQIIEAITKAFANTKISEAIQKGHSSE